MTSEERSNSKTRMCLTWEEIGRVITQLCNSEMIIEAAMQAEEIVAVRRGGIVPALYLSHKFNKPLVIINPFDFDPMDLSSKLLVLDDVIDTGKTYREIKKHINKFHHNLLVFGNLFRKPWAPVGCDIFTCVETLDWVVLPWESA